MHRTPEKRRTRQAMITAAAAVGLSGTLVLGQVVEKLDVDLAATVFAVGGRGDAVSANVKNKLQGHIAPAAFGTSYSLVEIHYPADFNFQNSTNQGVAALEPQVVPALATGPVRITSYSEGTLTAEQVKRDLANSPITPGDLTFLFIASPYVPNGGLFARFPGFTIPGIVPVFSAAQPTKYDSTYVVNEYDPYADFPAYFNPLSLANSLLAIQYAHPDTYYDNIDLANDPTYTTTVTNNGAGGKDTYVLVYNDQLPLFGPIRQLEGAVPQLTPFVEPVVSGIEPLARVLIDMGYTDRQNLNPATPTPFSLITPPAKLGEAAGQIPGALEQGLKNFVAGHNVAPPPTSETHTQSTPGVEAVEAPVGPGAESKTGGEVTPLQQPNTNKDDTPITKPKVDPKKPDKGLDKLVDRIIHPKVKSDGGKAEPTTKAPSFGHGPGAKLLKRIFGGGSPKPDSDTKPESPKPDNTKSESAAA
ncbi:MULTISPECIES: PE-PPE domain-containing protein [unclassified Mycobacterium]|uniref:PE-PPE domain-containing protein n=1 Tax=unclassified Mycobacterium TaxID=2642494 RepID=UPI0029C93415|nr:MULTISPECIES: PE-PPE domain-containing protein [unclassified Mycobacterium]